ncbi:MAG: ABC transporter ATP-binding protein [Lachnospiraceae bacterium]
MSEAVIKVNNVSKLYKLYDKPMDRLKESLGLSKKKRYKEHYALNHVSFEVRRGETVGIIGTNGSGKSTMLKIITGVLNPTEGELEISGRISALLELGAGFNVEYTGLENVYLNGTMIGFTKEEIDEKLNDILNFADIGDFIHQPVKTYSSGMFVRLAFAIAINIEPEILIVDEALSVGDMFFQAKCFHKFEEFKEMGKTILFVSHDLSSISKYCDRVVLLDRGHKMAEGGSKEMVDLFKQVLVGQASEDISEEKEVEHSKAVQETTENELWKNTLLQNPDVLSYGSKKAEIVDYAIIDNIGKITNNIQKETEFEIKLKVQFHEDIQEPIFAFTVKNIQGTEVTGTNTMYEKVAFGTVKAGEEKIISFRQNMNLQGNNYLLSFGCVGYSGSEFVVYHRLYDACNISVISDKNTVGFYDMNSQVMVIQ